MKRNFPNRLYPLPTALLAAALASVAPASAAERLKADVTCAKTDQPLVYDCTIKLAGRKSGTPVSGATLKIDAGMPSMPMAHNVKPVTAAPGSEAGVYKARIRLEMHGEWLLKIHVSGPTRDLLLKKMMFGKGHHHGG
jgi:hypothetical protein